MKKIRNQFNRVCGVLAVKAMEAKEKLAERSGEGYVDTAVKISAHSCWPACMPCSRTRCCPRW